MGYAKYVGRVGALALALGIGTAMANPAWAESPGSDTETSTSAEASQKPAKSIRTSFSADDQTSETQTTEDTATNADDADVAEEDDVEVPEEDVDEAIEESEELEEAPTDEASAEEDGSLPTAGPDPVPATDNETASHVAVSQPGRAPSKPAPTPGAQSDEQPINAVSAQPKPAARQTLSPPDTHAATPSRTYALPSAPSGGVPAPTPVVQQPKTPVGLILGGPVAFLDIAGKALNMLFNPDPSVPGDPPLLLGVLAFVRREIQRTFFNSSPDAAADVATTSEGTPTRISVLSNDTDPNPADVITITDYTQAANGVVALNADGSFVYTPKTGFSGTDTFTYTISDEASPWHSHGLVSLLRGHRSIATVTVTVNAAPVNQSPSAGDDSAITPEDTPVVIDVKANDTDPDDDSLTVTFVGLPQHGTIAVLDGRVTYTPGSEFFGTDTFEYSVSDGTATDTATVTVTVTPVNDLPVAANDAVTVPGNSTSTVIDVLANDVDADNDTLTVTVVGAPTNGGSAILNADKTIAYTPATGFSGTETFTYTISDGTATAVGTVTVNVTPVIPANTPPVAVNDSYTMPAGATSAVVNVLANDTDPDSDTLTVTAVTGATHGTATYTGGTITYTPTTGYTGTETLTYTVTDGKATTTATLTITIPAVTPVNTPPVANNDTYTMPAGATSAAVNVVANDTDPDSDTLTVTAVTGATHGTATYTGGTITYTPTTGYTGTETLTYTVTDGKATTTATLTITIPAVVPVNQAPVVNEPAYEYTTHAGSGIISGVIDVTDVDGDALTYTVSQTLDAEIGTLAIDPSTGAWQIKPTNQARFDAWRNPGEAVASFSVTVSDGQASVNVDIKAAISPAFSFDSYWSEIEVGDTKSVAVLSSDNRLFADSSDGLIVINPDGTRGEPILLGFRPTDAAFGVDGRLYLTDSLTDSIAVLDVETGFVSRFATAPSASGLAFDGGGHLFVTSPDDRTITVIDSDGGIVDVIGIDAIPTDVAVGADGTIYVAEIADDRNSVRLTIRDGDGSVTAVLYDTISSPLGDYAAPLGLAVGPNGAIFLADSNSGELLAFTRDGELMDTAWVDGMTRGIAVGSDGQIVVLSTVDNVAVILTPEPRYFDDEYGYTIDWDTNVVSGELYLLNPGGHLTFELTDAPPAALGTVTVDEATGAWVFVPSAEAQAAAAYGEYDESYDFVSDVEFIITASDGTQISANAPIFGTVEYGVGVIDEVGGSPTALTIGADGRIYVANRDNRTISVLNTNGDIVRTIELDFTPAGLASFAPAGYVVVSNGTDNTLTYISIFSDSVLSIPVAHSGPIGTFTFGQDGDNVRMYVANGDSVAVFDETSEEPVLVLAAPNPTGITAGPGGLIYIVGIDEAGAGYLKKFDVEGDLITTTLLGGSPSGIAYGPNDHLYISDGNGLPRDVAIADIDGWADITLSLGVNGSAVTVAPDGRVYIADAANGSVTVLTPPAAPPAQTPAGTVSTIDASGMTRLYGIAVAPDGRIIVTGFDADFMSILGLVEANGSVTKLTDLSEGTAAGVEVGPDGRIYVSDFEGTVTAYDPSSGYASEVVAAIPGATGLAFDDAGNLYVTGNAIDFNTGTFTGSLHIIKPDGATEFVALPGLSYDVQLAPDGRVFVTYFTLSDSAIPAGGGVLLVNADGTLTDLELPSGITPASVAIGPDGTLFIASPSLDPDSGRGTLVVRYPNGITRAIKLGQQPFGLDFDAEGRLLVTDMQSNTIWVLDPIYDAVNEHAPTVFDDPDSRFTSDSGVVGGAVIGTDLDGDLLTYSVVSEIDPAVGVVTVTPLTGQWHFTPTAQARLDAWEALNNDPDAEPPSVLFTVIASDAQSSDAVSITVAIVPGTQPTAQDPAFTIVESDQSSGAVRGQIQVVDADGDPLHYLPSPDFDWQAAYVSVDYSTGDWVFWPSSELRDAASNTPGADEYTFVVNVSDGTITVPVSVTVPVLPYTAPEVADPAFTITSTTASTGRVEGVLNVTDADQDTLTYVVTGDVEPSIRWVNVEYYTGKWSFTPTEAARDAAYDSAGEDTVSFYVTVSDGRTSSVVTVTAPIMPDMPPQVGDPAFTIDSTAGGVVRGHVNVSDAESGLTYQLTSAPDSALGYVNYDYWSGSWTFTPTDQARLDAEHSTGDDIATFVIAVSDGRHTVDVNIEAPILPNRAAPQPGSPAFSITSTGADGTIYGQIHATDPDSSALTYQLASGPDPALGYVNYSWYSGSWTFTPTDQARFDAASTPGDVLASFVITVSDGTHTTDITVDAPILPNLSAPQVGTPAFTVTSTSNGRVFGTVNVTDADGDVLTYSVSTQPDPSLGSVYHYSGGAWTFTPTLQARLDAANSAGLDTVSFVITATDGIRTVDIPITADIIPEAVPEAGTPPFAIIGTDITTGVVTGTVSVTDADGDPLTYSAGGWVDDSIGTVEVDYHSGAWVFTPTAAARYNAWADPAAASATFTIRATDTWADTEVTVVVDIMPGLDQSILQQLAANGDVLVSENPDGTVRAIHGSFVPRSVTSESDAADVLNVLAPVLGAGAGFAAPEHLTLHTIEGQDPSKTEVFYRLELEIDGIEVLGSTVTLVTSASGGVTGVFADYPTGLEEVETVPAPEVGTEAEAIAIASADVLSSVTELIGTRPEDAENAARFLESLAYEAALVVASTGTGLPARLLWRIDVLSKQTTVAESPQGEQSTTQVYQLAGSYYIYASGTEAGTIASIETPISAAAVTQTAEVNGTEYQFFAELTDWGLMLEDTARNIRTYRLTYNSDLDVTGEKQVKYNPSTGWDSNAVMAHSNITKAYNYFLDELNYRFFSNSTSSSGMPIEIYVGAPSKPPSYFFLWKTEDAKGVYNNAYWDGEADEFVFGSGGFEAALDVVAHEFVHGVVEHIVGGGINRLSLDGEKQSNALNEAYADILGSLIESHYEHLSRGDARRWQISEDADEIIRDMRNRRDFISDIKLTAKEHDAAEIFDHAFYRMVMDIGDANSRGAGRTSGVSDREWAGVFFNSLYRLNGNATFVDARSAVISSAKSQGFTQSEIEAIQDAFDYVGIRATNYTYGVYKETELGGSPRDVVFGSDKGRAYVVMQDGSIKVVDSAALSAAGAEWYTPTTIDIGGYAGDVTVAADGSRALATNLSTGDVAIIEGDVVSTVSVDTPGRIAVSDDGSVAYVTSTVTNGVTIIDTRFESTPQTTGVLLCEACSSQGDVAVSSTGSRAYVTHPAANVVSMISYSGTSDAPVVRSVSVDSPQSIATSADGTVAVVYSSTGRVSVIKTYGLLMQVTEVPEYFQSFRSTGFIALSSDGSRAWVTNHSYSNSVVAIDISDPADPTILYRESLNDLPHSIATTADGTRAYVVAHDHFWVLDSRSGTLKRFEANMPSNITYNSGSDFQQVAVSGRGDVVVATSIDGHFVVLNASAF